MRIFGEPIPGYSGFNKRTQADNIFGMTYAEVKRMAKESDKKIEDERKETLRRSKVDRNFSKKLFDEQSVT